MERQERKIMVEVTQEEYEKIKNGILENENSLSKITTKDLIGEIEKRFYSTAKIERYEHPWENSKGSIIKIENELLDMTSTFTIVIRKELGKVH